MENDEKEVVEKDKEIGSNVKENTSKKTNGKNIIWICVFLALGVVLYTQTVKEDEGDAGTKGVADLAQEVIEQTVEENEMLQQSKDRNYAQEVAEMKETLSLAIAESYMEPEVDHTIEAVLSIADRNGYLLEGYAIENTRDENGMITECLIIDTEVMAKVLLKQTVLGGTISVDVVEQ